MSSMWSRSQISVVVFFTGVWVALLVVLRVAPEIYESTLRLPPGRHLEVDVAFAAGLGVFIAVLVIGVARRWRWVFWLVLVAFLAGGLRVAYSAVQLAGVVPIDTARWYVSLQLMIGAAQLAIGMLMLYDYRRRGVWGRR